MAREVTLAGEHLQAAHKIMPPDTYKSMMSHLNKGNYYQMCKTIEQPLEDVRIFFYEAITKQKQPEEVIKNSAMAFYHMHQLWLWAMEILAGMSVKELTEQSMEKDIRNIEVDVTIVNPQNN